MESAALNDMAALSATECSTSSSNATFNHLSGCLVRNKRSLSLPNGHPEYVPNVGRSPMVPQGKFRGSSDWLMILRATLCQGIPRAGFDLGPQPWFPCFWSSLETEFLTVAPVATDCRWFGHSPAIAARFHAAHHSPMAVKTYQSRQQGGEDLPGGATTGHQR